MKTGIAMQLVKGGIRYVHDKRNRRKCLACGEFSGTHKYCYSCTNKSLEKYIPKLI